MHSTPFDLVTSDFFRVLFFLLFLHNTPFKYTTTPYAVSREFRVQFFVVSDSPWVPFVVVLLYGSNHPIMVVAALLR